MYANLETWMQIEKLQTLWIRDQNHTLASLISQLELTPDPAILDLGCGTAKIAIETLKNLKSQNYQYFGIDCDSIALFLAEKNSTNLLKRIHLLNRSALKFEESFYSKISANLLLALSNTFLSLGSAQDLKLFLTKLSERSSKGPKQAILSVVPWDEKRRSYHQDFSEWIRIPELGDHYLIKCSTTEKSDIIEQTLHIRPTTRDMSFNVCHRFLKMTHQEFEIFLNRSNWNLIKWIHPFNGDPVNPSQISIPEFYALCEAQC